jgi:hypothetical protein
MTNLSKRLEQIVRRELSKNLLPTKTKDGILVGNILISSQQHLKNVYQNNELVYENIHLNSVAIKIANSLALKQSFTVIDKIYEADQEYGKWYTESQLIRAQYQRSISNKDFEKADIYWAKYVESRDKMIYAKNRVENLIKT